MKRMGTSLTYANVMATVALFVALGGGAYAAGVTAFAKTAGNARKVDGIKASKWPKPGRLLALDARKKFPASVLPHGLAGPAGPKGDQGPKGDTGATGLTGDRGPSDAYTKDGGALTLAAGDYAVIGKETYTSDSGGTFACELYSVPVGGGAVTVLDNSSSTLDAHTSATATLASVTPLDVDSHVNISCSGPGIGSFSDQRVIAIKAATAHSQ